MKKMGLLVSLLVLLLIPCCVFAEDITASGNVTAEPTKEVTNDDGTVDKTYDVSVTLVGEGENHLDGAVFEFEYGSAVNKLTCQDFGDFIVTSQTALETGKVSCTFAKKDGTNPTGDNIKLGQVTINVDVTSADKDCSVSAFFKSADVKTNPKTGVEIPYLVIGSGLLLAAAVYTITNKRTKMYKI